MSRSEQRGRVERVVLTANMAIAVVLFGGLVHGGVVVLVVHICHFSLCYRVKRRVEAFIPRMRVPYEISLVGARVERAQVCGTLCFYVPVSFSPEYLYVF